MSFTLHRVGVGDKGAFGVLLESGVPFAVTLERTYPLDDATVIGVELHGQKIKIPPGTHHCVKRFFNGGGYTTYEILVPGHSALLFHKGNVEAHSEGCVLVGEQFSMLGPEPGVVDGSGLAEFLTRAAGRSEFDLEVT